MKEANTDWLKWISRKHQQASPFSFLALNLVEKAVLHYAGLKVLYEKSNWWLPSQENRLNPKNVSFQFQYRKFNQQRYSTLSSVFLKYMLFAIKISAVDSIFNSVEGHALSLFISLFHLHMFLSSTSVKISEKLYEIT